MFFHNTDKKRAKNSQSYEAFAIKCCRSICWMLWELAAPFSLSLEECLKNSVYSRRHAKEAPMLYSLSGTHRYKIHRVRKGTNSWRIVGGRTTKRKREPSNNKTSSMYSQYNVRLNIVSLHKRQNRENRRRKRREQTDTVERRFLNWGGQSDQEGAIECVRVRGRKTEG